jgi:hypothetical protein
MDEDDGPAFYDTAISPPAAGGSVTMGAFEPQGSTDDGECYSLPDTDAPASPLLRLSPPRSMDFMAQSRQPPRKSQKDDAPIVRLVSQLLREATMLKASHVILQCLPEHISVTLIIAGKPQEHDKIPTRLWDSLFGRLRKLARMTPAAHSAYEVGQFEIEIVDKFLVELHFADLGAGGPPSILIELSERPKPGDVRRIDPGSQSEPVKEWLRLHAPAVKG